MPKINRYWVKKRHNKTYKGKLTKKRKEINTNRAFALLVMWFVFTATYTVASVSNSFVISNDGVVKNEQLTAPIVAPERVESETALLEQVLPVMIETEEQENERKIREIAKEFDFKWENYLVNLACCEGLLFTDTINDKGNSPIGSRDRGLYGINDYWHSEVSDFTAHNLRLSTIWTMNHINNGKQSEFICDKRIRGVDNFYLRCLN